MVSFSSLLITNPGPKVHGPPMNVIILAPVFGKLSYLKKYLHTSGQNHYYENKRLLSLRIVLIKITLQAMWQQQIEQLLQHEMDDLYQGQAIDWVEYVQ